MKSLKQYIRNLRIWNNTQKINLTVSRVIEDSLIYPYLNIEFFFSIKGNIAVDISDIQNVTKFVTSVVVERHITFKGATIRQIDEF